MKKRITGFLLVLFSATLLGAQSLTYEYSMDWTGDLFQITITIPVTPQMGSPASARSRGEKMAEDRIEAIFIDALGGIQLNSRETVREAFLKDPALLERISQAAGEPGRIYSTFDQGMRNLQITYQYPLFPTVIFPFVNHTRPNPVPSDIRFQPTTKFTGIIIYLQDQQAREFRPSLFPELYDDQMQLLVSPWMMDPESLRKWGSVAYDSNPSSAKVFQRTGPYPLHILAKGLYGKNPSDLIISFEDAQKIRTSKENRELIRQGKIAVIFSPPE